MFKPLIVACLVACATLPAVAGPTVSFQVNEPVFCGKRADVNTAVEAILGKDSDTLDALLDSKRCLTAPKAALNGMCEFITRDGKLALVKCFGAYLWTPLFIITDSQNLR